jgi:hypothetical protein
VTAGLYNSRMLLIQVTPAVLGSCEFMLCLSLSPGLRDQGPLSPCIIPDCPTPVPASRHWHLSLAGSAAGGGFPHDGWQWAQPVGSGSRLQPVPDISPFADLGQCGLPEIWVLICKEGHCMVGAEIQASVGALYRHREHVERQW